MIPNPCTILAVDPGRISGAALMRRGKLLFAESVDTADPGALGFAIGRSLHTALVANETLVMVGETWGASGGFRGLNALQGLSAAWGAWKWGLDHSWKIEKRRYGAREPAPKTHRVHTSTWRSKIFGKLPRKGQAKRMAVEYANQRYGIKLDLDDHDIAEAVCIATWATYAKTVLDLVPARFR